MGKISVRAAHKRISDYTQKPYSRGTVSYSVAEKEKKSSDQTLPEPPAEQHQPPAGLLTPHSSSVLNANFSSSGSMNAPVLSQNHVNGDLNVYLGKHEVAVEQSVVPLISGDKSPSEAFTDPGTPQKIKMTTFEEHLKKPTKTSPVDRLKGLHSAGNSNIPRRRLDFDDVEYEPQLTSQEGNKMKSKPFRPKGKNLRTSVGGEITGSRVTAEYQCDECGAAVPHFKAKAFMVKCTECKHSWKCDKLEFKCTAKITIELRDGRKRTVILSDPLLRSIVTFNTHGFCNTDKIERKVLKVCSIRVYFMHGHPIKVQKVHQIRRDPGFRWG